MNSMKNSETARNMKNTETARTMKNTETARTMKMTTAIALARAKIQTSGTTWEAMKAMAEEAKSAQTDMNHGSTAIAAMVKETAAASAKDAQRKTENVKSGKRTMKTARTDIFAIADGASLIATETWRAIHQARTPTKTALRRRALTTNKTRMETPRTATTPARIATASTRGTATALIPRAVKQKAIRIATPKTMKEVTKMRPGTTVTVTETGTPVANISGKTAKEN